MNDLNQGNPAPDRDGDNTPENEDDGKMDAESLLIQKKRFREQRDEARSRAESLAREKAELEAKVKSLETNQGSTSQEIKSELEQVKFAMTHKDLDLEDVNLAVELARAKGISLDSAYDLPLFKLHLKDKQEQATEAKGVPESTRSAKFAAPKPVSEMSDEEHKAWALRLLNS